MKFPFASGLRAFWYQVRAKWMSPMTPAWISFIAASVTDALRRCEPISKTAPVSFWTRRSTSSSAAVAEHGFST